MKESTTQRQTLKDGTSKDKVGRHGLVKLHSIYNAAVVGLSKYIKEYKDRLNRLVQECDTRKAKYPVQKVAV